MKTLVVSSPGVEAGSEGGDVGEDSMRTTSSSTTGSGPANGNNVQVCGLLTSYQDVFMFPAASRADSNRYAHLKSYFL